MITMNNLITLEHLKIKREIEERNAKVRLCMKEERLPTAEQLVEELK